MYIAYKVSDFLLSLDRRVLLKCVYYCGILRVRGEIMTCNHRVWSNVNDATHAELKILADRLGFSIAKVGTMAMVAGLTQINLMFTPEIMLAKMQALIEQTKEKTPEG